MSEKIFHCGMYPHLVLTVKPFGRKDIQGNSIPAKHLNFQSDIKLGAGILRVSDLAMQEFVLNHEYSRNGKIVEVTGADKIEREAEPEKVSTGTHDTRDVRDLSGQPKDGIREVTAARGPGRPKK